MHPSSSGISARTLMGGLERQIRDREVDGTIHIVLSGEIAEPARPTFWRGMGLDGNRKEYALEVHSSEGSPGWAAGLSSQDAALFVTTDSLVPRRHDGRYSAPLMDKALEVYHAAGKRTLVAVRNPRGATYIYPSTDYVVSLSDLCSLASSYISHTQGRGDGHA